MPANFNGSAYFNHVLTFKNTDINTKRLFESISAFHNRHRLDSIWSKNVALLTVTYLRPNASSRSVWSPKMIQSAICKVSKFFEGKLFALS